MSLQTYNDFVSRVAAGYDGLEHLYGETQAVTTGSILSGQNLAMSATPASLALPSTPAGVTAWIAMSADLITSTANTVLIGKAISLGSINLGTNTFTAGSTMPTVTELGASNQTYSAVVAVVTSALNSSPGSLSITYNASDGTTGNTTTATALTASAAINTAGMVALNDGHWGASQVTGASQSGGSSPAGVVQFFGYLPLCIMNGGLLSNVPALRSFLSCNLSPQRLAGGDVIKAVSLGATSARALSGTLYLVGDN